LAKKQKETENPFHVDSTPTNVQFVADQVEKSTSKPKKEKKQSESVVEQTKKVVTKTVITTTVKKVESPQDIANRKRQEQADLKHKALVSSKKEKLGKITEILANKGSQVPIVKPKILPTALTKNSDLLVQSNKQQEKKLANESKPKKANKPGKSNDSNYQLFLFGGILALVFAVIFYFLYFVPKK